MKKIYTLIAVAAISLTAKAQQETVTATVDQETAVRFADDASRTIATPTDTTGWKNTEDFWPVYGGVTPGNTRYRYKTSYLYGNHSGGAKAVAQRYENLNLTPIKVVGAAVRFYAKRSSLTSSANSKVTLKVYDVANEKAYNTDYSTDPNGVVNTTILNHPGPNVERNSADLLFSDIDTTVKWNYISFPSGPSNYTYNGDIILACHFALDAGDTVGIYADAQGNGMDRRFGYHLNSSSKWIATDMTITVTTSGTTPLPPNCNIALFAVVSDATGVEEFFNGVKLAAYPNPAVNNATIEYQVEKNTDNVVITVLDNLGRTVIENNYSNVPAATAQKVNVDNLAAGTYFYQINADGRIATKQLIIAK